LKKERNVSPKIPPAGSPGGILQTLTEKEKNSLRGDEPAADEHNEGRKKTTRELEFLLI